MPGRRAAFLAFGVALGTLFLWLAVGSLHWHAIAGALALAHPAEIALGLASLFAYYGIKALRWRHLIAPFAKARTCELLPAVLAGLAGNYVFPHAGEIPRAVLAGRRLNAPPSALLGSIAVERFFDFLALLVIALAVLLPLGRFGGEIRSASLFMVALCAALLAAIALFVWRTEGCLALARRLLAPISSRLADGAAHELLQARVGLGAIAAPRLLVPIFGLSLLQWLALLGCVSFSLRAVDVAVTPAAAVSVLLLNVIGLTLPAAPGHVGTVQLAFIVGLTAYAVPNGPAFAASVVYNLLMVVPTAILGLPGLRRAGEALGETLRPD
jgi:uncharacterized protein (TIRG00374 family)